MGYLTAFLNSKIFRFAFKEYFPELLGDTRELSKVFFEMVTVKPVDDYENKIFEDLVDRVTVLKGTGESSTELENEIEQKLGIIYSLTDMEKTMIYS